MKKVFDEFIVEDRDRNESNLKKMLALEKEQVCSNMMQGADTNLAIMPYSAELFGLFHEMSMGNFTAIDLKQDQMTHFACLSIDDVMVSGATIIDVPNLSNATIQCFCTQMTEVMEFSGVYINHHHSSLLCDRMTCNKDLVSIFRSGILSDNIGPIAKATFGSSYRSFT